MMQHGAYRSLIDEYMVHGPLPNDLQRLYRISSAFNAEERAAVEYVLGEFFVLEGPTWRHRRCDLERTWQDDKSESARQSAAVSWKSRRNANAKRTHKRTQSERNANQNQNQNQISDTRTTKSEALALTPPASGSVDPPAAAPPPVISIPLNDKTEFPISASMVAEWETLYGECDVMQTLREIRGWNLANPNRRKTRTGILNHINRWLAKEHNRG
jgi:uncharacterized protein YdaU (DUF1376 family)